MKLERQVKSETDKKIPITFFAPPERQPIKVVHRQASTLNDIPLAQTVLSASLNYMFILNAQRQIVMASENVLELVPGKKMSQIIGLRPGEALGCIHSADCKSGCGTGVFCRQCSVVTVILEGLGGNRKMEECQLTRKINSHNESLHLRVLATPLLHNKEQYVLVAMLVLNHVK